MNIDNVITGQLSILDWLIFTIVLLLTVAIGYYNVYLKPTNNNYSKKDSYSEYLIMGRRLTLPLFITTLVATWYGGIFGVTQIAFEQGIYNFFTQGIFWYISYILFAIFIVTNIRSYNVATLPELILSIYGNRSSKLISIILFFKILPVTHAISIGIFLQLLFQIPTMLAVIIGMIFVIIYSFIGGFRTIVFTDLIQFITMFLGVSSVLFFSIINFGGIEFLKTHLPTSYFRPCGTHNIPDTLTWLFIAISSTFINPSFYQRCFAAKSTNTAIIGILISIILWIIFDICTTIGAMYAYVVLPKTDSLGAYLIYALQILPIGWKGLLLASIAATILSTLDSYLFIASNILSYDLAIIKFSRIAINHTMSIIITSIITISIIYFIDPKIEHIWLTLRSYSSACLLFPLLFGCFFPRYISDKQFVFICLTSCFVITIWKILSLASVTNINEFYIGNLTTFGIILLLILYKKFKFSNFLKKQLRNIYYNKVELHKKVR